MDNQIKIVVYIDFYSSFSNLRWFYLLNMPLIETSEACTCKKKIIHKSINLINFPLGNELVAYQFHKAH